MDTRKTDQKDLFSLGIDGRQEEFIQNLKTWVSVKSISSDPSCRNMCAEMSLYAQNYLNYLGAKSEFVDTGIQQLPDGSEISYPPILFSKLGCDPKKKTLLIYGHLDVQPAKKEDGWNTDPFTLTEIDGKLYGRGSTDDKGPVLSWFHAISELQRQKIEIPFVLECMEESGSEGLEEALIQQKETFLKDVDFVCISDSNWLGKKKPCLTYGLRGICYYCIEIQCAKQDLHSGDYGGTLPEAMKDLCYILSNLDSPDGKILIPGFDDLVLPLTDEERKTYENMDFDVEGYQKEMGVYFEPDTKEETLMKRFRYPALSVHGIEGAFSGPGAKTVIPSKVIGKFSIRLVPNMTPEAVDKLVLDYINSLWDKRGSPNRLNVYPLEGAKPWLADYNDENFQAASRALKHVFGVAPDYTREGGSIPITLTLQELTGKSVLLLPIGACDDMAHSQNEKIDKMNFIEGTKALGIYLLELANA